jgi:hypothetical protein
METFTGQNKLIAGSAIRLMLNYCHERNVTHITCSCLPFYYWRAPQQMPRTHRSLEGLFISILMEHRWNEIYRGKPKYSGKKTCPSATLSSTNPTWTDPGLNLGLRGERPATKRLNHGTAMRSYLTHASFISSHSIKVIFMLLHVLATYCSHLQRANSIIKT